MLTELPVERLLADDLDGDLDSDLDHRNKAVVALWATNNQRQHAYITDVLFPLWGLELRAKWIWLKVGCRSLKGHLNVG